MKIYLTNTISFRLTSTLLVIVFSYACVASFNRNSNSLSPPEVVLSFVVCNFDFGSTAERQAALDSKAFIPEKCFLNKVESYRGCLYIAVPRLYTGVPFSLVKVVKDRNGSPILQPFPNRDVHSLGDCNDIQMSLSFTIDTNTGIMWLIDAGHVAFPDADDPFRTSYCPAKLLAIKLRSRKLVLRYVFPETVVPAETNILNDLVLDYVKGELAFIYITDTGSEAIVVYDVKNHDSFNVKHSTMSIDQTATLIPFPNGYPPLNFPIGINGIAISCDFRYVYYKVLSSFDFYRIPTDVLRRGGHDFDNRYQFLGRRNHHVDGMMYSSKHILYYSATNESAIDRWLIGGDAYNQGGIENVKIQQVQRIAQNDLKMEYSDCISINEKGNMYFMAHRVNRIAQGNLDITGGNGTNFHIWRQHLGKGERSYMWRARHRTAPWRKHVPRR